MNCTFKPGGCGQPSWAGAGFFFILLGRRQLLPRKMGCRVEAVVDPLRQKTLPVAPLKLISNEQLFNLQYYP